MVGSQMKFNNQIYFVNCFMGPMDGSRGLHQPMIDIFTNALISLIIYLIQ